MHGGGTPQARGKALARLAIQDIMRRELTDAERRDPWVIMLDAFHRLDVVMTTAEFDSGGAYVEHLERVLRMGKALVESKAVERMADAQVRRGQLEGRLIADVLVHALGVVFDEAALDTPVRERLWRLALGDMRRSLVADAAPAVEPPYAVDGEVVG